MAISIPKSLRSQGLASFLVVKGTDGFSGFTVIRLWVFYTKPFPLPSGVQKASGPPRQTWCHWRSGPLFG
jgi:hypothetical protein